MTNRPWRAWVSTYQSATQKTSAPIELECLEDLYTLLEHEDAPCTVEDCRGKKCPHKDGLAWSPGYILNGQRCLDGNVQSLSVSVFDLDHLNQAQVEDVCERLEGVECLLHSTHTHRPPGDHALRLVLPLSRAITRKEHLALWHAVIHRYDLPADPKAKNPSRIYFLPRRPQGAPSLNVRGEGTLIDVDALLLEHHKRSRIPQGDRQPVVMPEAGETDLKKLRDCLRWYNPDDDFHGEKKEMIRRVLAEEPLADKPGCSEVEFQDVELYGRDDAVFRAATIIGWQFPLNTPVEVAMELMRPSIAAIPVYEDDGKDECFDGWMHKAELKYQKAQEEKLKEMSADNKLLAAFQARRKKNADAASPAAASSAAEAPVNGGAPVGPVESSADAQEPPPPEDTGDADGDPEAWRLRMQTKTTESGDIRVEQVGYNVSLVLEEHQAWKGALRFNELTKEVECIGGPIAERDRKADLLTAVENWLQSNEQLNLHTGTVAAQLRYVARRNAYDPVKDYLNGLVWDGVERLDTVLEKYAGAGTLDDTFDVTDYIRKVGAKWMIGGVARGLTPGCQVDNVLVLEGAQGIGKTTFLRILGGPWYAQSHIVLTDKDSKMLVAGSWIIELAELSAMRQTETEQQKSFFADTEDRFRPPYGKNVEVSPRHCIFAGTTNEGAYLRDETGNRRFWPVLCGRVNFEALRRDRDQLWAEAVVRFKAGESWHMTEAETVDAEAVATRRLRGDNFADVIWEWWLRMPMDRRPLNVTAWDVATGALDIPKAKVEEAVSNIGRAMKKMGFSKKRVTNEAGLRQWVYEAKKEHLELPRRTLDRKGHLTLIAGAKATNGE